MEDRPYFNETNKAAMTVISALVRDLGVDEVFPGLGKTVCFFSLGENPPTGPPGPILYKLSIERWRG